MNPPQILHHYTNSHGLHGIIKSKKIWASSYRYMNDSKEFDYGFDLITEIYPEEPIAEQLRRKKWDYEADCLFVASFSEEGDSLSQWRGYANPPGGYAVGFRTNALENGNARLVACEYNKNRQLSILRDLINNDLSILRAKFDKSIGERRGEEHPDLTEYLELLDKTVSKIAKEVSSFKHNKFCEEKEWRLIVGPANIQADQILYRPTDTAIVPYIEIDYKGNDFPIDSIIVGPGPHQKRDEISLVQMLSIMGFNKVNVHLSDIPYQNW